PERIVFIGQKPRYANQNLGYITFGDEITKEGDLPIYEFVELQYSPPMEKAKIYATDKKHAWNLGYFATTPRFMWKLCERFEPEMFEKLQAIQQAHGTETYENVLEETYPTIEKISFDN